MRGGEATRHDNQLTMARCDNQPTMAMQQLTDDGATTSWPEDAEAEEGDERGRSRATQQSTDDGAMRQPTDDDDATIN